MSAPSLLKFMDQSQDLDGNEIHWSRAGEDGLPFRGKSRLYKSDDEYEANVSRMCDFRVKKFSLDNPTDMLEYAKVMDRIANKWFRLFYREHRLELTPPFIYVEWGEFYMQEASSGLKKAVAAPAQVGMPGFNELG